MAHHSHINVGDKSVQFIAEGYDCGTLTLFTEDDRVYEHHTYSDEHYVEFYGYRSVASRIRDRLQVRGFTTARALSDMEAVIAERRGQTESQDYPADVEALISYYRDWLSTPWDVITSRLTECDEEDVIATPSNWDSEIGLYMDQRSLLRILVDLVPSDSTIELELTEFLCCNDSYDPSGPLASTERALQLASIAVDAPLIVLTEGSTDSLLLSQAMTVTHPHLSEFIRFIDFASTPGAEGSVGVLPKTVHTFLAAGVANRFVAIADNDTAAHVALAKIKQEDLPLQRCRILHYPDISLLEHYPTRGPGAPQLENVNGSAGSLEMYFGRDCLTIDGELAAIQWTNYEASLCRYHGSLPKREKLMVQHAFRSKVQRALAMGPAPTDDWSGIQAILDTIIKAFN